MQNLPSHRHLLTTLIQSLPTAVPSAARAPSADSEYPDDGKLLRGGESRRILLTLHVLFPNLLLPALDLLDRGLVTRARLRATSHPDVSDASAAAASTIKQEEAFSGREEAPSKQGGPSAEVFVVRSLASTTTRRTRDSVSASSPKSYLVRLRAWNCSCAGFAFDSFSPRHIAPVTRRGASLPAERTLDPGFGGLSLDGGAAGTEEVPCCKHLLACLLFSEWGSVLDKYVEERNVTKDELAGIVAGA